MSTFDSSLSTISLSSYGQSVDGTDSGSDSLSPGLTPSIRTQVEALPNAEGPEPGSADSLVRLEADKDQPGIMDSINSKSGSVPGFEPDKTLLSEPESGFESYLVSPPDQQGKLLNSTMIAPGDPSVIPLLDDIFSSPTQTDSSGPLVIDPNNNLSNTPPLVTRVTHSVLDMLRGLHIKKKSPEDWEGSEVSDLWSMTF